MTDQHLTPWKINHWLTNDFDSDMPFSLVIENANKEVVIRFRYNDDNYEAMKKMESIYALIVLAVNALPFRCDNCDKEFLDEEVLHYSMDKIYHFDCDNPGLRCSRCGYQIDVGEIIHTNCLEDSDPKEK